MVPEFEIKVYVVHVPVLRIFFETDMGVVDWFSGWEAQGKWN